MTTRPFHLGANLAPVATARYRRVALIIGNASYPSAPLKNPRNDAESFAAKLRAVHPAFDVMLALDAGREAMENALYAFEDKLADCDTGLLFFAGHGLQVKGLNYLIPVDADIRQESHLQRRAISLNEVLDIMGRRVRTSSLVFLDACRDNPFARSLPAGLSNDERGRFLVRSGLAEVRAAAGSFVAFATAPDNVALDGTGSNSPFTAALVAHMGEPNISINDVMLEVGRAVRKATGDRQVPWIQSCLQQRFCFNESLPTEKNIDELSKHASDANVTQDTIEHTKFRLLQEGGSILDLQGFLLRFPNGNYAEDASRLLRSRIRDCNESEPLEAFLQKYVESEHRSEVERRLAELLWSPLNKQGLNANVSDLRAFIKRFPETAQAGEAQSLVATLPKAQWQQLKRARNKTLLEQFLAEFPDSDEAALAKTRVKELEGRPAGTERSKVTPARLAASKRLPLSLVGSIALFAMTLGVGFFVAKKKADPGVNGYVIHGVSSYGLKGSGSSEIRPAETGVDAEISSVRAMGYSVTVGKSYEGPGEEFGTLSFSECAAKCENSFYCNAFDYNINTRSCRDAYAYGSWIDSASGIVAAKVSGGR